MDSIKINVLGTEYEIIRKKYDENPEFKELGADGYIDDMLKKIHYCDMSTFPKFEKEPEELHKFREKKTLRHEIIHAFLSESGLAENSCFIDSAWAMNEEMVDWIAIQFPKILKVFMEVEAL